MERDVYGEALYDFHVLGDLKNPLLLHSSYGDIEEMPIEVFFRDETDFPELEHIALALCDGHVLDVGAGVGSHALYLQDKGFKVDALEISEAACSIMKQRGVQHIIREDFFSLKTGSYDTLLFLMNGVGLAGTIAGLRELLRHSKKLLSEKGQLLFDSSNISYLYEEYRIPKPEHYFGEIRFQYEYKGNLGKPFQWLYIDQQKLIKIAHEEGWVVQILFEDDNDQYLVRMEPRKG
ncbi:class I SAM-dependent methyltransferase [Sphingobacterium sp. SGR-19]|uniref:class I SAM-dependent methyltransferase n=1 Tax=Sphingobacterium sp. SGR-19 TaxID=2710886 RepID=UPI0013ED0583|nr:class I SAM-dependent methyltransferase [Sphingobacterium sp. SGR-19]NGM64941.1 class I SAM-dependent methyltransferase [Sphingobacterium sp. SGR-19]